MLVGVMTTNAKRNEGLEETPPILRRIKCCMWMRYGKQLLNKNNSISKT